MKPRPIIDLLNIQELRPAGNHQVMRNRRKSSRFAFKMSAVLVVNGSEYPAECLEVSSGGLRVRSHRPLPPRVGATVMVKMRVGQQHFADTLKVIHTSPASVGTYVHLELVPAEQPALAEK